MSFLAINKTQILPQPPYFPDIAPNDFLLFPKLKAILKGRHFDNRDDIIEKSLLALKSIPKEAYKNCFDNWEKRWRWCVEARGDFFEKWRSFPVGVRYAPDPEDSVEFPSCWGLLSPRSRGVRGGSYLLGFASPLIRGVRGGPSLLGFASPLIQRSRRRFFSAGVR
ncbi:hypothetical protein LAZ67_23000165 [Cordylochernes scorpioides]|uniref:Histone-lysine N-methyltransferase SETMAR n=1 Tax=Cordylochernes scorpioides TaxID=51811 RepID=A0ABY6LPQ7_9ARAC|nr:hypothetical protein LAZ67_23000165 [Cordylochernes scorpioides]